MAVVRRALQSRIACAARPPALTPPLGVQRFSPKCYSSSVTATRAAEQPSRWPRRFFYATVFASLGLACGKWMDSKVSAPPVPGSEEDARELEAIKRVFETGLPFVKDLRDHPDYVECGVYENYTDEQRMHRLTSGSLRGSRGVALQKVFWNEKEKSAIGVAFLGPGLEGWPTVVHGGALATVIDEHLGRIAVRHFPERTGVTANLTINYRAPVYSDSFYTFHTTIDHERSTDRKAFALVEVRDLTGKLCAEATGIFVVPKTLKLNRIGENF
ncbi:hypothetical protein ASPZODRAFT_74919 [Penicilliopsis zonata CBS 506.65]|uniref:Thioesterase domain-containing protein n=1 Tax=Penicilliopsis zonata CBS 506.65 TaxID=1073090 RepID=A0A1L9S7F9_9EURO|nr:hypothetical protein ASPZODRAFT_74919 [Penicilliopsis zonata CBS 506.65]OJJ43102.1 hypothetical protein ASPZODRAFT_74919 [Penicilliopsis zonata CBS 506.65]